MIKMSELDKAPVLLTEEIEKTRRRVNALEYVMIPNLEDTIKFITIKLTKWLDRLTQPLCESKR